MQAAIGCIAHRGPDASNTYFSEKAALGHTRLAIIDTSTRSNQPMSDVSGRYTIVFNGEVYNYIRLAEDLRQKYKVEFVSHGDTEVLLYGLIHEGKTFLNRINGFFAFGFYDRQENSMMIARDRYGIKPLYYASTSIGLVFASTLSALISLGVKKTVDFQSLATYLQLSYIPAPQSILEKVFKLLPGHVMMLTELEEITESYYTLPETQHNNVEPEKVTTQHFRDLLEKSVASRLIADVPVGTFLSGGLDSSVITLLASQQKSGLDAFSIGFPDQPFFDESPQAKQIAKHLGVHHNILEIREKEIEQRLYSLIDAIDEPFADSSAVLVNLLSEFARKKVKVALSGDGADELLGGYNKHRALWRSLNNGIINTALKHGASALEIFPASRNRKSSNAIRQAQRYSRGLKLEFSERYWSWACFSQEQTIAGLLRRYKNLSTTRPAFISELLKTLNTADLNTVLKADFHLVLPNDMLHKVDLMSMHRGLEVRVPFLDHRLVDFAFNLPATLKSDSRQGKKILRKAFEKDFPSGFFDRPKRGFEAPLAHWMNTVLSPLLDIYMGPEFVQSQNIFELGALQDLRKKVAGPNPGDSPHTLWAVLVFQHWWKRTMDP